MRGRLPNKQSALTLLCRIRHAPLLLPPMLCPRTGSVLFPKFHVRSRLTLPALLLTWLHEQSQIPSTDERFAVSRPTTFSAALNVISTSATQSTTLSLSWTSTQTSRPRDAVLHDADCQHLTFMIFGAKWFPICLSHVIFHVFPLWQTCGWRFLNTSLRVAWFCK